MNINLSRTMEDNRVTLEWVNDFTGATTYEIYKRECENTVNGVSLPGVFKLIATVYDTSYIDLVVNIVPSEPTEPDITKNIQIRKGEMILNLRSQEGGTKYEYYVHGTSDVDKTNAADSNKTYATAINGVKGFRYAVKKITTTTISPPETTDFKYSDISAIQLKNLEDGTYAFWAKAVDNLNIESKVSKEIFTIINEYFDEKRIIEEVPVGVRYNHRYRGPQESKKIDFMHQQIRYNLNKLKDKVSGLEKYINLKESTRNLYDYLKTNSHKLTMRTCAYNAIPIPYSHGAIILDNKIIHTQTRGLGFVAFDKHMNIIMDKQYDTHGTPAQMNNIADDVAHVPTESFIAFQGYDSIGSPMEHDLIILFDKLGLNGTQMSADVLVAPGTPGRVTFQALVYITRNASTNDIETSSVINHYYDKNGYTASNISNNLGLTIDKIYSSITYDKDDFIEKPVTYYQDIAIKIEDIEEVLSDIREEIKYEQRNN